MSRLLLAASPSFNSDGAKLHLVSSSGVVGAGNQLRRASSEHPEAKSVREPS